MKRAVRILLILLLVVLGVGYLVKRYVGRHYLGDRVSREIAQAYGGAVKVADVDVGVTGTDLHGFQFFEKDCGSPDTPWLTLESLSTDLTLTDLLGGKTMPTKVTAIGAKVVLRFNALGKLLTCIPERPKGEPGAVDLKILDSIPEVAFERGQVTLQKAGAADLVLDKAEGKLSRQDQRLVLVAKTENPAWGPWTIAGGFDPDKGQVEVTLQSQGKVAVTQAMLDQVPFVPASVWQEARFPKGETPVRVEATYNLKSDTVKYRVVLDPLHTQVQVPQLGLHAEEAHGKVAIDDHIVTLRHVEGSVFGGNVRTEADLDFSNDPSRLIFRRIEIDGASVERFPESWGLPQQLAGKLTGNASLKVTLAADGARTEGNGKGVITEATLAGQPVAEPIKLSLHAVPGGFRFGNPGVGFDTSERETLLAANDWSTALGIVAVQDKKEEKKTTYLDFNLKMKDVDLAKFVKDMKAELPFEVAGRLSFDVKASIPLNASKDWKQYKLKGSAELRDFAIDEVRIGAAVAQIEMADGVLRLPVLKGMIDAGPKSGLAGSFDGSASLQVEPLGELKFDLAVAQVPLRPLARLAGLTQAIGGVVSGQVHATTSAKELTKLSAWKAFGNAVLGDLRVEGVTLEQGKFDWTWDRDRVLVKRIEADLYQGQATGSATIPLEPTTAGSVNLQVKSVDAGALAKDIAKMPLQLQGKIDGELAGTLPAAAPGKPRSFALNLKLESPQLRVQNVPAESIQGRVKYDDGVVDYQLQGKSLGGTFELEGQVPPAAPAKESGAKKGKLSIQGVQLGRLLAALKLPEALRDLRGRVHFEATFTHAPVQLWPEGSGRLRITDVRYKDRPLTTELAGDVVLAGGRLSVRDFTSELGGGLLRVQLFMNLNRLDDSRFTVSLDGVESSRLLEPWLGDSVEGPINARIRGRLGNEISGTADVEMTRGKVRGLQVSQWRAPATFRYVFSSGRAELEVPETTAQAGAGRLTGKLTLGWDGTWRTEGQLRFTRVDLESFLRQTAGTSQVAGGSMTGKFEFAGRDMRSLDDLTGKLEATFEQSRSLDLPVLKQVAPYVGVGPATTFQKGDLSARLERSLFRIQRLSLEGPNLQMFVDGTVSLEGRLNLEVTASTSNLGFDTPGLRLLGLRIPVTGPLPIAALREASALLSNRLVHLHVTGTITNPIVRVAALATLTQEAARYFLRRNVGSLPFSP